MLPVRLELYNFLAYRDPGPIDFSGIHLACLAGANGAGKSSLLDAMTWALWGKARTRRDDDLIYGGEIEMRVAFTFQLEGNTYRVSRYRNRKGRGTTILDFEVQDGDDWRTISEPTIRATQDRITSLLRLDYDTFINSAFLLQGRADEFTQKTPGERKAILGEILGLAIWEEYEDRVKRRLKEIGEDEVRIDSALQRIDEELGREGEYKDELIEANRVLTAISDEVREAETQMRALEDARRDRDARATRRADLASRTERDRAEWDRIQGEREGLATQLEAYQAHLASREEIEVGFSALQQARQLEREFNQRLLEQTGLRDQFNEYQQAITAARSGLEAEQRSLSREKAEHEQKLAANAEREKALEDVLARIEALEAREVERDELREQRVTLVSTLTGLEATNQSLKAEMDTLKSQQDQISASDEPVCPLCGQELSDDHRADLLDRLRQDGKERGDAYRANVERIGALEADQKHLTYEVEQADNNLRNLPPLREHAARLSEQLAQADEARSRLAECDTRLAEIAEQLEAGAFAEEAQAGLADLQARLAEVGYDEQAHQQAREDAETYEPYEAQQRDLDRALEAIPTLEEQIAGLDARAEAFAGQIEADGATLDELTEEIAVLDEQLVSLPELERSLAHLRDQEAQAHYRVGAAEQKLHALEQQRQRREGLIEDRNRIGEERGIYEELRLAFGKDGIPAMIIEAAIPEIENEANEILSRMTDGRMHVRFDTQREKVTGGLKETLDINIADELGTRDYDTFSGGEAFRVNFAIRLALSRLLARRAGAQLRTLIIDEGFGTQDASGRERLVQAITAIKEDFDLILVITHIDELKDAFPVRIEITKTPEGSQIEIV